MKNVFRKGYRYTFSKKKMELPELLGLVLSWPTLTDGCEVEPIYGSENGFANINICGEEVPFYISREWCNEIKIEDKTLEKIELNKGKVLELMLMTNEHLNDIEKIIEVINELIEKLNIKESELRCILNALDGEERQIIEELLTRKKNIINELGGLV